MKTETVRQPEAEAIHSGRSELRTAGLLMVGGFLLNLVSTLFHPGGAEDNHEAIFAKYADSGSWVAVHLGQFVGVLLLMGGLIVLYRVMASGGRPPLLAHLAAAATVASAATWAVLQGLDGIALKQAVVAWNGASGTEEAIRFAGAEIVRWLEWGFQSYFRVLVGVTFMLFGAAILTGRRVVVWLGWTALLAGLISAAIGVDVGYSGLESGLQDVLVMAFLVATLAFALGILATGMRERGQRGT